MALIEKSVLITVKTYPNPSKKYGETVCCAGIDLSNNKWVRLYPIPYRDLDSAQKFEKYTVINVMCQKPSNDSRPESFRVKAETITKLNWLDSKNNWRKRKEIVLKTVSPSFSYIKNQQAEKNKSLGTFKPIQVDFAYEKAPKQDHAKRKACYAQLSFFNKNKKSIEYIPYNFYYSFKCQSNPNCPGHRLPITDWEIGQAYRQWRHKYSSQELLLAKIREKWLNQLCSPEKDTYFFVGNMKRFPNQFMVLGVFWPKKE